jgi:alanyl-tRNA synthetase
MLTKDIRQSFIEFFKKKNHKHIPSASLLPPNDPTVLFNIAGMNQFKSILTGKEKRTFVSATTHQKCLRMVDIEDVGKDARHLTFFEMLGNWSFGDYGKKEAISFATDYLLNHLKISKDILWITIHPEDSEAKAYWMEEGFPQDRIVPLEDNFWAMGPQGPCGPCTEIYVDLGPSFCSEKNCCQKPGCAADRFLEIWNLVFMEWDQTETEKRPLPFKSIDTGAGLERLALVMQKKRDVFEIDVFQPLKIELQRLVQEASGTFSEEGFRVIADHLRALIFTLADGGSFSSEGRGYVLRKILRRASFWCHRMGIFPSLSKLIPFLENEFSSVYPEISLNTREIKNSIEQEELRFQHTLEVGLQKLESLLNKGQFSSDEAFLLYDSYGFPIELTKLICEEKKIPLDLQKFNELMEHQKTLGRTDSKFYQQVDSEKDWISSPQGTDTNSSPEVKFCGYGLFESTELFENVPVVIKDLPIPTQIRPQKNLWECVFLTSPFYPQGGGQIYDTGWIKVADLVAKVLSVEILPSGIVHTLEFIEELPSDFTTKCFSSPWKAYIDVSHRLAVSRNHTSTHLLNSALRNLLGDHVHQAGSFVDEGFFRFDFTHSKALTAEEISTLENQVNTWILSNFSVETLEDIPLEKAKSLGAIGLFEYTDKVRIVRIQNPHQEEIISIELCGGTHVRRTGDIGVFKIISESSVTAGVRRLQCVTGTSVPKLFNETLNKITDFSKLLRCPENQITAKIQSLFLESQNHKKEILDYKSLYFDKICTDLKSSISKIKNFDFIFADLTALIPSSKDSDLFYDKIKQNFPLGIFVLLYDTTQNPFIFIGFGPTLLQNQPSLHAGKILQTVAKGGGKKESAKGTLLSFTNSLEEKSALSQKLQETLSSLLS